MPKSKASKNAAKTTATQQSTITAAELRAFREMVKDTTKSKLLHQYANRKGELLPTVLSDCVVRWIYGLLNPFGPRDGCLPMPPCLDSTSLSAFARGSASIGTMGNGFVSVNPAQMVMTPTGLIRAPVRFSIPTYASTYAAASYGTLGVDAAFSNTVIPAAAIVALDGAASGGINYRIWACGLRIRYTGTTLNQSGIVVGWRSPSNNSFTFVTEAQLLSHDTVDICDVGRRWHNILWYPVNPSDYAYSADATPLADNAGGPLLLYFTGVPGQTFEYETFCHAELIGPGARGKQRRMGDPIGGVAALDVIATAAKHVSKVSSEKLAQQAEKMVIDTVRSYSGPTQGSVPSAATSPLIPRGSLGSDRLEKLAALSGFMPGTMG